LTSVSHETGRQVVGLGLAVVLTVVALDHLMVGHLSLFFDLCFVTLCLGLAFRVDDAGLYVVALLPPLLMLAAFALVGAVAPGLVADPRDGVVQAVVSGLAHHSEALAVGYAVCLATLEHRRRGLARERSRLEA